ARYLARLVEAALPRAGVILRGPPLRRDPPRALQPLQRRVERAVIHFQHFLRRLLYVMRDVVAMQRAEEQSPQDQHVERALQEVDTGLFSSFVFFRHNASGRFSTGVSGGSGRMSMGDR